MSRTATIITPSDHGRRMSLEEFEFAEAREGHLYELGRGKIIVTDVPNEPHGSHVDALREQLYIYRATQPGVIQRIYTGSECKILAPGYESERHPDLAIYKTPPPSQGEDVWRTWAPEIVVEVVSRDSRQGDYDEKPPEYLAVGVQEYWIADAAKGRFVVHRRRGDEWETNPLKPGEKHTTPLLPGFELDVAAVLAVA